MPPVGHRAHSRHNPVKTYTEFRFFPAEVKKVVVENPKVKSLHLKVQLPNPPKPGQFVMVWLPGAEEIPMSVSDGFKGGIRISVAKEGETTAEFHELKRGDSLFVRGPFGVGFSLEGNSFLLVGGGYGVAPLVFAAKSISSSGKRGTCLIGAKNASELLFTREARRVGMNVHVATEDGSAGHKGVVVELLEPLLSRDKYDSILTCGPERMMYEVIKCGSKFGVQVQASLERYMKCGFGVCGSCVLDPLGLRVCVDGPVFEGDLLLKTEFGEFKRDASGARVSIRGS